MKYRDGLEKLELLYLVFLLKICYNKNITIMKRFLINIIAAGLGLYLAALLIPDVTVSVYPDSSFFGISIKAQWQIFLILGIILGLLNYFVKPILKVLSLPLQIITLGLFGLIINLGLIYIVDLIFKELYIGLWMPLVYTALIIWGINTVLSLIVKED